MRDRCCMIVLLILALALGPAPASRAQSGLAHWTFLVYLDADNNLEREAIDDFIEMATVGSNADVNVIVQFDRIPGYDSRYGDWTGTLRFRVTAGMTPEPANALADLGEANMGDPETLADFVTWGKAAYPARRTALVLWNHGDGWRAASTVKEGRKAICWDDTNGHDALDLAELRQVMAAVTGNGATPIDLIAFDACLMAMIEVDVQIQPYARVRVASEETEPGSGYPFDTILADLRDRPDRSASDLGQTIVQKYYEAYKGETQSAVDLGDGYLNLVGAVDQLAQTLIDHAQSQFGIVGAARREVQQFQGSYIDLYHLAELLDERTDVGAVQVAAQAVMAAVDAAVLIEEHGTYWPGAHGISIYFPALPSSWDSLYDGENNYLAFTAQTQWDDFLMAYLDRYTACDADAYEPDGDPPTAAPIEMDGAAQRHNFCPANDAADWVAFQAQAGQTIVIETANLDTYCDTVLKLYDADGQTLLAEDDDDGPGWASRIEWTSRATGVYYVQVSEYFGRAGQDTDYTLRLESVTPTCSADGYEPDDGPTMAATLPVDGPAQEHSFCPEGDVSDWASFQAVQGQVYTIETHDLELGCDTALELFDRDGGTSLAADTDSGGEPRASRIKWTSPANGQYFVRVREQQGRTGEGTGYKLSISAGAQIVRGKVRLQGRTSFAGTQVSMQPIHSATPAYTATTATSGAFVLAATPPCTVTASHPSYLAAQWVLAETSDPERNLAPVTLLAGDVNGDMSIDILDIAYMGARFDSTEPRADLNGDGVVDILDLVLAAVNFGQTTTPTPIP